MTISEMEKDRATDTLIETILLHSDSYRTAVDHLVAFNREYGRVEPTRSLEVAAALEENRDESR